ncbi:tetratricopeptide repeat protein [Acidicapsa dinghuensis]|uniref:Tetratricopeptide repeat protein n=1 Tax=Acidicapsa dinghuensis TaxID=2218256 RepID=A0ABW1EFY6_9BACT|nr:tetratricopeptide repeat protein [Acidicapsa dinghuensis]
MIEKPPAHGFDCHAVSAAEKALSQKPDDPAINILVAEALVGERDFEAAEPYLKKL